MKTVSMMKVAGAAVMFATALLLCGCEQKAPTAPPAAEGRSESQMDQEYRSILVLRRDADPAGTDRGRQIR
jgi:hypothetical protein